MDSTAFSKLRFRLLGFVVLFFTLPVQQSRAQGENKAIDSLLRRADILYQKNPEAAIGLARLACSYSSKKKLPAKEIRCFYVLTYYYWGIQDFNNAALSADKGLIIAKTNHIDSICGDFSVLRGAIDHLENNYQQAIIRYKDALPYYKVNNLQKRIGNTYVDIGICEMRISHLDTANIYFLKSASIFQRIKDTVDLSATYNSMGACFTSLKNTEKAINYHKEALNLRIKLKDHDLIAQSLNNLGDAFNQGSKTDSAITYLSKCLEMRGHELDTSVLVHTLQNLGSSWKKKGNLERAEAYNLRAVKIAANYNRKEDLAHGYLDLAGVYTAKKKYNLALECISKSLSAARGLNIPDLLIDTYAAEFTLSMQMGDYKNALLFDIKKDSLQDSTYTVAKNQAINELEIKYQTRQKEKDIAALNIQNKLQVKIVSQQKQSIIMLIIAAVLLFLLLLFAYNSFRIKNNTNRRIQNLMRELHHRVKNNLQILAGLFSLQIESMTDENTKNTLRENESRLTSMNLIHNKLYHDNSTTQIEMGEYLTNLLHHIKNSFDRDRKSGISLRTDIDAVKLDADKAVAIGLIVNELATNAFKYAFDDKPGEISLGLKYDGKSKLLLSLSDNGKGIPDAHKENAVSFGLKLVNLMVRQLNSTVIFKNDNGTSYQIAIHI